MEEVASRRTSVWMSRSRRLIQVICICMIFVLLPQSTYAAASRVGSDSFKAELFHREHPSSRLQSRIALTSTERLLLAGKRSADRVSALDNRRRLSGGSSGAAANRSTATLEATLSNAAPAEYVMSFSLGSPPQNFVAVADTGSDLTWLQCKPCQNCLEQPNPVFDPALSSTYKKLNCSSTGCSSFTSQYGTGYVESCAWSGQACEYSYLYMDLSNTTGTFSSDTINLRTSSGHNISVPDFWFGCSHSSFSPTALLDSTDGLVGLGQGQISFTSQLGNVFTDQFSYCLVNRSLAGVQSSPLLFGHDAVPDLPLQYTPILCNELNPYYYYIDLQGISVGGLASDYNSSALAIDEFGNGGTILDSGTTYTYLDPLAYDALLAALVPKVPSSYERVFSPFEVSYLELCYNVTGKPNNVDDLPQISLKFRNSTSWDLAPQNAWLRLLDYPQVGTISICLSIMRGLPGVFSVIGNAQQQDFYVVYDRVHKSIGFAQTDCGAVS